MNEVEKKIKEKAQARQAQMSTKEKEEIQMTAEKMKAEAAQAKKTELTQGKGNGKPKAKTSSPAPKQLTRNQPKPAVKNSATESVSAKQKTQKQPESQLLTTKDVAAMVGTDPKSLRRVLRANWYNDGVTTHYGWTKDDPDLKKILDYYKEKKAK